MKVWGLVPNSYIHVSVSDWGGSVSQNGGTISWSGRFFIERENPCYVMGLHHHGMGWFCIMELRNKSMDIRFCFHRMAGMGQQHHELGGSALEWNGEQNHGGSVSWNREQFDRLRVCLSWNNIMDW